MRATSALRDLAALALGTAIALAGSEVAIRALKPSPRAQVVDLRMPGMEWGEVEGVTLWWSPLPGDPGLVRGDPCPAGVPVVGLAGDSLLAAVDAPHEDERVRDRLEALLAEAGVPACVRDGSWGGYVPDQQFAMLRHLARERLDVAVTIVWKADRPFHRVGDRLYDTEALARDADGVPLPPLPVPADAHRWLLPRSRLWEYATLALAREVEPPDPARAYLDMSAWAAEHEIPLVFVEGVPLDRPLTEAATARDAEPPDAAWERVRAAATTRGQPYVMLAHALAREDVTAIRNDTCCHYNHVGHDKVARAILPVVLAALRPPSTGSEPAR